MDEEEIYRGLDDVKAGKGPKDVPDRKISEAVFDKATLMSLYKLTKRKAFEEITGLVSVGKEANVYHGVSENGEVAVKVYKIETSDFRHMSKYVRGDPRFASWRNRRQLVHMWAQKEYKNLMRVHSEVPCPKPLDYYKNVLVMDFVGDDGVPSPKLKESPMSDPQNYFEKVVGYVKKMYSLRLVHADLSEYNILDCGGPVIIDYSAGVLLDHPRAHDFLRRDIENVCNFFRKNGVDADYVAAFKEVTSDDNRGS